MFAEYDECLSLDCSIDFWSDVGICDAWEILSKFSDEDWNTLSHRWRENSNEWKVRCAETIDSHSSQLVIEILLGMLEDEDSDVVIAAADALRSLTHAELRIPPATLDRIVLLRDRSGIVVKTVLSDFIKRTTT